MAKKKTNSSVKRRRRSPMAAKSTRRRRSMSGKSKGFLNDITNPVIAMQSAKTVGSGAAGGAAAILVNKLIPATTSKFMKLIISGVGGFGAATFGMPNVGAGFTGGMVALNFATGFLSEDMEENEFADETSLEEMPLYLDAEGEPFIIEEDSDTGESYTRYLTEEEKEMVNY